MTIAEKTASLTKVINETVKELEVTQSSLDAQVSTAEGYETTAETNQATAEGYRDTALSHAASISSSLSTAKAAVTYAGVPEINQSTTGTAVDVFVYDTSKDSDGGAWRKRTQHTSWYNEDINGKWLGFHQDETHARNAYPNLGSELVTNGTFDNGTTGWSANRGSISESSGELVVTSNNLDYGAAVQSISVEVGAVYHISVDVKSGSASPDLWIGTTWSNASVLDASGMTTNSTYTNTFVASASTLYVTLRASDAGTDTVNFDNISVRKVTSQTTVAGDYYKNTTDGKFYSLSETSGQSQVYRGNRREFPAVALISVEAAADKVVIYDADDPTLPMWMVFNASWSLGTGTMLALALNAYSPMTSTYMLNGKLAVGSTNTSSNVAGLHLIDFIQDKAQIRGSSYNADLNHSGIADRNLSKGLGSYTKYPALASGKVRDVAMTVFPDAPVDTATGLPVPTIAVGLGKYGIPDGGVSVIKHDGTVVDIRNSNGANGYETKHIAFDHKHRLIHTQDYNGGYLSVSIFDQIPDADIAQTNGYDSLFDYVRSYRPVDIPSIKGITTGGAPNFSGLAAGKEASFGFLDRISLLSETHTDKTKSMVAYVSNTYNTGWQQGGIKLAALSDTDTSDLDSTSEQVVNGTFDTDTSGWTPNNLGLLSVDSQRLKVQTGNSGSWNYGYQQVTVVPNRAYRFRASSTEGTATKHRILLGTSVTNGSIVMEGGALGAAGSKTVDIVFTATTTSVYVALQNTDGVLGSYTFFDNVSIVPADADRSHNGSGLIVNGTISRTPVATGAELVGYNGISGVNFLSRNFNGVYTGQSTFTVMFWVYGGGASGNLWQWYEDVNGGTSTSLLHCFIDPNTNSVRYVWQGRQSFNTSSDGAAFEGRWSFQVLSLDSGSIKIYEDGKLVTTSSTSLTTPLYDLRLSFTDNYSGALFRVTETTPTADQIKKIYDDEKALFQENAACTLYGSSSAVTALAYDDSTNLLHVGTSAGRSVFDGLQRVDNTTTPVASAISASNGLIAED
jgi:hypothetical protein